VSEKPFLGLLVERQQQQWEIDMAGLDRDVAYLYVRRLRKLLSRMERKLAPNVL
jgi:hypothetical protein